MKRLTPALISLLMLVIVGGLIAAYIGKRLLAREEAPAEIRRRNIPVAITEIRPGTVVTEAHLGEVPIRVDRIGSEMLLSQRVILGRVAREPIEPLQPIRTADLYPPGEGPPIEVADGMRAVTTSVAVLDGLTRPGQHVDVHFTPDSQSDERFRGGLTMTLFEGVKVLAVRRGSRNGNPNGSGTSVTFEMTPEQANVMILAERKGDITLSFNPAGPGADRVALTRSDRANLDEILGLDPLPEPEKPFRTEVFRSGGRTENVFQNGLPQPADNSAN